MKTNLRLFSQEMLNSALAAANIDATVILPLSQEFDKQGNKVDFTISYDNVQLIAHCMAASHNDYPPSGSVRLEDGFNRKVWSFGYCKGRLEPVNDTHEC